jgi:hypothetical protein
VRDQQSAEDKFRSGDMFARKHRNERLAAVKFFLTDRLAIVFVKRVETFDEGFLPGSLAHGLGGLVVAMLWRDVIQTRVVIKAEISKYTRLLAAITCSPSCANSLRVWTR